MLDKAPLQNTALDGTYRVLNCAHPRQKALAARQMREDWCKTAQIGQRPAPIPDHPARPDRPNLVAPNKVARRKIGSIQGRGALLHAIAHIELNAIDLAADMILRFYDDPLLSPADQAEFISDWSSVCDDEARHFIMLEDRLISLELQYGDFDAHNGLWEAALNTCDNFTARLAIAPLVLEARGLDVTPGMITKLTQVADHDSAEILKIIYKEEINHVRIGSKWFQYAAQKLDKQPKNLFQQCVKNYFKGQVKPPFNVRARTLAGLSEEYYQPLAKVKRILT